MGYLPLEVNFDFETTCGRKTNNFAGDRWLYPTSYSVIIAFHHRFVKYIWQGGAWFFLSSEIKSFEKYHKALGNFFKLCYYWTQDIEMKVILKTFLTVV